MSDSAEPRSVTREELRFFGDVCAAISHEINNRMAVISEKAGLVEDLAAMAAKGKEVDPERFLVQGRKIADQLRQARQVVGNLNRFAHSVDVEKASVEMAELLEFVIELYTRKAAMSNVSLVVSESSGRLTTTADPFAIETLVGRGLELALLHVGDGGTVDVGAEAGEGTINVVFSGLSGVERSIEEAKTERGIPALLERHGARLRSGRDGTALILEFPDDRS